LKNKNLSFSDLYLGIRGNTDEELICKLLPNRCHRKELSVKIDKLYSNSGNLFNDLIKTDSLIIGGAGAFNLYGKVRMAPNSQIYRSPYLIGMFENYVYDLPIPFRKHFAGNQFTTKYLFRKSLLSRDILPIEIAFEKKSWMYSPNAEWLRNKLGAVVEKVLLDKDSPVLNYFNCETIRLLIKEHMNYKKDHSFQLMILFTFNIWHKIFIDSEDVRYPIGGIKALFDINGL
jgi:hypothetical protein